MKNGMTATDAFSANTGPNTPLSVGQGFWFEGLLRCPRLADLTNKAEPLATQRANQPLLDPIVANGAAHCVDARGQSRIRNDPAAPDCLDQFVLSDYAITVMHEISQ